MSPASTPAEDRLVRCCVSFVIERFLWGGLAMSHLTNNDLPKSRKFLYGEKEKALPRESLIRSSLQLKSNRGGLDAGA
jgi:hypothetical protein